MNVKVRINKLGEITNSDMELSEFMIFSGDSGLGKSYTAFLSHYVHLLLVENRFASFFKERGWGYENLIDGKKDSGLLFEISMEDLFNWINKDAVNYLRYILGNPSLEADLEFIWPISFTKIPFKYKEENLGLNNSEEVYMTLDAGGWTFRVPNDTGEMGSIPFRIMLKAIFQKSIFGEILLRQTLFFPPSRGLIFGALDFSHSSGMYMEFKRDMTKLQTPRDEAKSDDILNSKILKEYLKDLNGGEIAKVDDKWMFLMNGGTSIPLTAAASSVKELAPFNLFLNRGLYERTSILFEEPEAHLHPSKQTKIAKLLVATVNQGTHLQITTHSDYLIRTINDSINLYRFKEKYGEDAFDKVCEELNFEKDLILNPEKVRAYYFQRRGDGSVEILHQDVSNGIPYDTFQEVIKNNVFKSETLSERLDDDE